MWVGEMVASGRHTVPQSVSFPSGSIQLKQALQVMLIILTSCVVCSSMPPPAASELGHSARVGRNVVMARSPRIVCICSFFIFSLPNDVHGFQLTPALQARFQQKHQTAGTDFGAVTDWLNKMV